MAVDVIMPQMGESIFEGTITKWLKKAGDKIERDEPLFEISTDKVDAEIPSPSAGVLKEIKVNEGQTVPIQTVVAIIEADGAAAQSAAPAAVKSAVSPSGDKSVAPANAPTIAQPAAKSEAKPAPSPDVAAQKPAVSASGEKVRSSPLVRRIAREHDVDLTQVPGSGAGGRVSKRDILAAVEGVGSSSASPRTGSAPVRPSAPAPAAGGASASAVLENAVPREKMYFGHYEVQPMSVMRQRIAEHMVLSKRVSPHVYSIDEADMTHIAQVRAAARHEFEQKHQAKLTFMPFFVRACVDALRDFPMVNASVDGTNVVLHGEINIGIAVALDGGLIVPVLKNAEEKNFLGLQRGINDLAERARAKKLKPEEVQEGTFSITNPGIYGGLMGLPVINQPNVAILGIGAIQKRPMVIDDAIAVGSMVYLTLSYDHRVVDGAGAHPVVGRERGYSVRPWPVTLVECCGCGKAVEFEI